MQHTYFDYAAATPLDDEVLAAMQPYFAEQFYNPSALYQPAREVRQRIDQARESVARQFGVNSSGVYFTAGITEANNLLLHGLATRYDKPKFIISAIEHESVSRPAKLLAEDGDIELSVATVNDQGEVSMEQLFGQVDDNTVLISIILVNNETGVIQQLSQLKQYCSDAKLRRKADGNDTPLFIHSDAAQVPGVITPKLNRLGVDIVSVSAAKIYGPKQSAALVAAEPIELAPLITGGSQERGVRAGTENVANIIGLEAALQQTAQRRSEHVESLQAWQSQFEAALREHFGDVVVHSEQTKRAPHISNVVIPGVSDGERLVMELDQRGFLAATGSACTAGSGEPSTIITAMSGDAQQAAASLRVSYGRGSSEKSVDGLVSALRAIVSEGLV